VRVIVAGAGVGGLTAALALRAAGIEVTVFEQMEHAGATMVGGGFHLWPNAIRALRELALDEPARQRGAPLKRTEFHSSRGRRLAEWPIADIARGVDAFDVGIARQDLMGLLYNAIDHESVTPAAKLVDFDQDAQGVTARLADGREERGDVLVGADGLRSVVRAKLLGAREPDYAGYVQWQTVIEGAEDLFPAEIERLTFGPAARTVMHHVAGGRLFWACVVYCPMENGGKPAGRKASLLERFKGWPEPIATAIDATPEEQIIGLPIFDRRPVESWGRGRVTLLGDAAHPMTTNTSQGGNQAIEDGVLLGRLLGAGDDPVGALRAYEQRRIARTTPLVKNSRWLSNINAWGDPIRVAMRDVMFRLAVPRKGLSELRKAVTAPL
jgi:2-polyprenyl-6-methoxyphenol hydroxylase-like FAD-dependent oxidoreductase